MQMGMFTKDNGWMIKLMELVNIRIKIKPLMRANGKMINNMEQVQKSGLMDLHTMDSIKMDKNTVMDS